MNDDNKKPVPQDDEQYDSNTHRLQSRYTRSELDVDEQIDDLDKDDFLPPDAELSAGLGKDGLLGQTDVDEDTLPSEDNDSVASSGLDENDASSIGKQNLGDIVMRPEDSINDTSAAEIDADLQDFAGLEDEYLEEDEPTVEDLEKIEE